MVMITCIHDSILVIDISMYTNTWSQFLMYMVLVIFTDKIYIYMYIVTSI